MTFRSTSTFRIGVSTVLFLSVNLSAATDTISVTVDPREKGASISPYIYGANLVSSIAPVTNIPFGAVRIGGNRLTGYNWETNASNAGTDYLNQSDSWLTWVNGINAPQDAIPAAVPRLVYNYAQSIDSPYTLLTVPLAGYVASDKSGPVGSTQTAPSNRWVAVVNDKPTPLAETPDTADDKVYVDEFVSYIGRTLGKAGAGGPKGYCLDNEPDYWDQKHPRLHPLKPTCVEILTRTIGAAKTIKRQDSDAETHGPCLLGTSGYIDFQSSKDWSIEKKKGAYTWFIDYYLDQLKIESDKEGHRLLDVLDLHRYSDHQGAGEVVSESNNPASTFCNESRLQAPRVLWDPTFHEESWVQKYFAWTLPYLPKLKASIDKWNPGTKIGFSEYSYGGESLISGGIAQADVLGIYGKFGVHIATFWPLHEDVSYALAAFRLFLNCDGNGAHFGSTTVTTSAPDPSRASVYASIEGTDSTKLHIIVINKSTSAAQTFSFELPSTLNFSSAKVFGFGPEASIITERTSVTTISGGTFNYEVPALSAYHFIFQTSDILPSIAIQPQGITTSAGTAVMFGVQADGRNLAYQWYKDGVKIDGQTNPTLKLSSIEEANEGLYNVDVSNAAGHVMSDVATLQLGGTPETVKSTLINLSTRALVRTGGESMIAGFVIKGNGAKRLLLRAVGPTLGIYKWVSASVLEDPMLVLRRANGTQIAANNDWEEDGSGASIAAAATLAGAFPLSPESRDSALVVSLPPGLYTAQVTGVAATTGIAIVEVYDLDDSVDSRLTNLSTRAFVGTGDEALIIGFVISGSAPKRILVRGVGKKLADFGLTETLLADPHLDFLTQAGAKIGSNENWGDTDPAGLSAVFASVGAFALDTGSEDAAMLLSLAPGVYTPLVSGTNGESGVLLLEAYEVLD